MSGFVAFLALDFEHEVCMKKILVLSLLCVTQTATAFYAPTAPGCQESPESQAPVTLPEPAAENCCDIGEPIRPATGEVYLNAIKDAAFENEGSHFALWRSYRSLRTTKGSLGNGWVTTLDSHVKKDGPKMVYQDEVGASHYLEPVERGVYQGIKDYKKIRLTEGTTESRLSFDGSTYVFGKAGELRSLEFPSKQKITLHWQEGRVVRVSDDWGKSLVFDYAKGLLSKVSAQWGTGKAQATRLLVSYSYDAQARLVQVGHANNETHRYTYLEKNIQGLGHYLLTARDGEGRLIEGHQYDEFGRGVTSEGQGGKFRITYSAPASLIAQRSQVKVENLTKKTSATFEYDANGNFLGKSASLAGHQGADANTFVAGLVKQQQRGGQRKELTYQDGQLTQLDVKAGAKQVSAGISYRGDLPESYSQSSVLGGRLGVTHQYDGALLVGQTTTGYTKDLTGAVVPVKQTKNLKYNSQGQLIRYQDPATEQDITLTYHAKGTGTNAGRIKSLSSPSQKIEFLAYDFFGYPLVKRYNERLNTVAKTDDSGKVIVTHDGKIQKFDRGGLKQSVTVNDTSMSFRYDSQRSLAGIKQRHSNKLVDVTKPPQSFVDQLERTYRLEEDARGNLVAMSEKGNEKNSLKLDYDMKNRMVGMVLPNGFQFKKTYDDFGRLVEEYSSVTGLTRRAYDVSGKLTGELDAVGNLKELTYRDGKLVAETFNKQPLRKITYGEDLSKPLAIESAGIKNAYRYDLKGRTTLESLVSNGVVKNVRYVYGQYSGSEPAATVYPDGTQLINQEEDVDTTSLWLLNGKEKIRLYTHGRRPGVILKAYGDGKIQTQLKLSETFDYSLVAPKLKFDFKFDAQKQQLTSITSSDPALSASYEYGAKGFLARSVTAAGASSFAYDAHGSPTSLTQNKQATVITYEQWLPTSIQKKGEKLPVAYDAKGRMVKKGNLKFNYNAYDLLSRVETTAGKTVADYLYDGAGRRVAKIVDGVRTDFVYDLKGRLISEARVDAQTDYFYHQSQIVAIRATKQGTPTFFYPILDQTGSPLAIMDAQGIVVAKSDLGAYERRLLTKNGTQFPHYAFSYPGQYIDQETGLAYNMNRYYDPELAQYTTSDPRGAMGGFNTYAYAFSNPNSYVDRDGLQPEAVDPAELRARRKAEDARICGMSPTDMPDVVPESNQQIWKVGDNRWTEEWEEAYGEWVAENVNADFYTNINQKTDCADAAFGIRAIFARIHKLPIALEGFVEGSMSQLGHSSTDFKIGAERVAINGQVASDDLWASDWKTAFAQDSKFRKFLSLANSYMVGTSGNPMNTHPIKLANITEKADGTLEATPTGNLRPGSMFMNEGHTYFIDDINRDAYFPISTLNSTVPAKVRDLASHSLSVGDPPAPVPNDERGFLNWNWSAYCGGTRGWKVAADNKHADFKDSDQQYALVVEAEERTPEQAKFASYVDQISGGGYMTTDEALGIITRTAEAGVISEEVLRREAEALMQALQQRVQIVEDGLASGVDSEEHPDYDAHSTPSRDSKVEESYDKLSQFYDIYQEQNPGVPSFRDFMSQFTIELPFEGVVLKPSVLVLATSTYNWSSEPWDTIDERWGVSQLKIEYASLRERLRTCTPGPNCEIEARYAQPYRFLDPIMPPETQAPAGAVGPAPASVTPSPIGSGTYQSNPYQGGVGGTYGGYGYPGAGGQPTQPSTTSGSGAGQ